MRHGASFYPVLRQKQIRKHITSRVSGRASKTPEAAAVAEQCGRWPGRAPVKPGRCRQIPLAW